ncbi:MAG: FtsQ-type POTRA domain-containing protein [Xanthomonadales bacterium]|nr:FtsQ-type POTRA domain-containing protein [Xanthomonadales bacterium]
MAELSRKEVVTLLGAVAICVVAALAALGARSMFASQQLPIRWIEANGAFERVTAQQIRTTAAPLLTGGFFGVDLDRVRLAVEAIPWIRSAGVQRRWPDKVTIRVVEHQPLGQWGQGRLVSDAGEIFEVAGAANISGMVLLAGPDKRAPEVVKFYLQLSDQLKSTGLDVSSLSVSERGAWQAHLTGGIEVQLGSGELKRRTARLVVALPSLMEEKPGRLKRVDLRYTNGLAARWRDEPSLAESGAP